MLALVQAVLSLRPGASCVVRLRDLERGGYRLAAMGGADVDTVASVIPFGSGITHAVMQSGQRAVPTGLDLYRTLTEREREVLHLAAEEQTSAQIGARLNISPRTVEVHRANLMRKLGLRGQSDLVRFAVGRGILTIDG